MSFDRRKFLALAGSAVAAPAVLRATRANAQEVTLRMHHFLPPVANGHSKFLKPWADKVGAESNGRIKIDIFPSMQLGGTPPQLYDQARDGVVDIVWTLPGNTPGRFTGIEAFELPFVANKRALVNSLALTDFAKEHLKDEFKDIHPICFWAHDHGLIHANKSVKTMEDLKGLKLRFPTRLAGEALRALGVNAIGMPIPQVPESLAQRVIDGCVVPWEVVPSIKVQELVKNHTEIPGSPTLYVATFVLAMNKAKYEGLAPDLKAIIDKNSGAAASAMAGKVWDEQAVVVSEMVKKRGNTITTIDEAEAARWRKATEPVIEGWIKTAKDKGLDGDKLLAAARAALTKHQNAA
ncbi:MULTISPECIES: TRAP transporter substrate-binding protein [unclassified Bosea (in: a-proteobacteria)]|uniref:TRAP transporter substrate-binding protein n=1 Tax=unclassified Bosea (in: a-proteobacteria) TaxID=2653178 RepID=UPI000F74D9C0|nr:MULTISPECIES: TRAP transporter substrate-binding protein [unclassified Bosea (in: a-proteobacteria)]AZO76536.1 C4-dicarboxylate ABC transporter [Bosea sp. Tri-49]RXT21369.1 C4-dicarboxylate ABC transporter [Bosea sp. Tri-39]RXT31708.1 C4-dicarboxylate ABC transporter [Bosea sp. Tri-54]